MKAAKFFQKINEGVSYDLVEVQINGNWVPMMIHASVADMNGIICGGTTGVEGGLNAHDDMYMDDSLIDDVRLIKREPKLKS